MWLIQATYPNKSTWCEQHTLRSLIGTSNIPCATWLVEPHPLSILNDASSTAFCRLGCNLQLFFQTTKRNGLRYVDCSLRSGEKNSVANIFALLKAAYDTS